MSQQPEMVETTVYVQLDPKRHPYYSDRIQGMRLVTATSKKPEQLRGRIVVALKVRLPASVFEPLEPSATITLDESAIMRREDVEVDAVTDEGEGR